jgi:hypothetical protein
VEGRKREAVIYVRASGSTRVLQLKPKEPQLKKDPERKKEIDPQFTALFSGVGISVINEKPEELLYITFEGLRAEYASFAMKQSIYLEIKDCQVSFLLTVHCQLLTPISLHPFTKCLHHSLLWLNVC